jgi:nitrogen fixation protein NifU and related proteins
MDADLRDLYQEVILDHNRKPRNFGPLDGANRTAKGDNPLCGDKVTIHLLVEDGVIADLSFEGSGCAISTASASLMTGMLKGKKEAEATAIFKQFHGVVTGQLEADFDEMGKLAVFAGVSEYPVRVKCATLAWHTVQAALGDAGQIVSTE